MQSCSEENGMPETNLCVIVNDTVFVFIKHTGNTGIIANEKNVKSVNKKKERYRFDCETVQ